MSPSDFCKNSLALSQTAAEHIDDTVYRLHSGGFQLVDLIITELKNHMICLTLKEAGGVQNDPLVRRMSVISHMVMLWSQKFLTISINMSTRRY